jgi:hypothetical protein
MKRLLPWLLLALAVLISLTVAALAICLPKRDEPILTKLESWALLGNIQRTQPDPKQIWASEVDKLYFVAVRDPSRKMPKPFANGSGWLVSRPFAAPGWIGLCVTGDLTRPGNNLYFRQVGRPERFRVSALTPKTVMRRVTCRLPPDWEGTNIEMVVESGPRDASNWFAVSNPRALASGTILVSHLRAFATLPVFLVTLALFLLPGLAPAARLAARGWIGAPMVVPAVVVFSCLAGYLVFWAYFLHPIVGLVFGGVVLPGSAAVCAVDLLRGRPVRTVLLSRDTLIPLGLTALVGLFYFALLYTVDLYVPDVLASRSRFLEFALAIDNELPFYFADRLFHQLDPRALYPGWQSSDRPPLQAGLLLLQMPCVRLAPGPREYSLIAGSAFQCAWVPALWALLCSTGLPRRRAGLALLFAVLTGFSLVNTVYTWPKMLSAALCVFAATWAPFGREKGQPVPLTTATLLGLSAALASLTHGGVAFTLLPVALFLLLPRYYPGVSRLVVAGTVYAAVLSPWLWYQTHYDPPGNKLIREHIAGNSSTWSDDKSVPRNLLDAYAALSPWQVLQNKLANLQVLFRASREPTDEQYPWPPDGAPQPWPVDTTSFRRCEFMCLFWAPGLMNLGWLVGLAAVWRRSHRLGPGWPVAALGLAGALTWVVIMFGPGSTVTHQGSYATVLLLFAALAGWLATLPGWLPYGVLGAHAAVFAWGWLLTSPAIQFGLPDWPMVVLALVLFVALVRLALGARSLPNPSPQPARRSPKP